MATTNTTTLASAIKDDFIDELLEIYESEAIWAKLGGDYQVEMGEGDNVILNRLLRSPKVTAALSEGQTSFTPKAFKSNKISVDIAEWGDVFEVTKRASIVSLLTDANFRENIRDQILASTEYQVARTVCRGAFRERADADGAFQQSGQADAGSSAIALVDASLDDGSDNYWGESADKVGYCTVTSPTGANYDITSVVTDFVHATDTATVAFPQALDTTSKYRIFRGTGLAAGDVMDLTNISKVAALHEFFRTPKFKDGVIRCVIDAETKRDLYMNSDIQNIITYDKSEAIGNYEVFRLLDTEFIVSPEVYREDVDGTENNATGVVRVAPFLGRDAFQVCHWGDGSGMFGLEMFLIDKPDSGNYLGMKRWFSWYAAFAGIVNRATAAIGMAHGVTDLGVLL